MKIIAFDDFWEYISKKPLIPNTTKVLKTKKIKISKNKFNPKNVCCALNTVLFCKIALSKLLTRTNDIVNAKNNHLIWVIESLLVIDKYFKILYCKIQQ